MRQIITHLPDCAAKDPYDPEVMKIRKTIPIYVVAMDDPEPKTKLHFHYEIGINLNDLSQKVTDIRFQKDNDKNWKGITEEAILAALVDRLERLQNSIFACEECETALSACELALDQMVTRAKRLAEAKKEEESQ